MKIGLVASSGGHLSHLLWLRAFWQEHDRYWVTFDHPDARERLSAERVFYAHHPTNRHAGNLAKNLRLAATVTLAERPDLVVSSGAGLAPPFLLAGQLAGAQTVFLEVADRVETPSLSGRLCARFVDAIALTDRRQQAAYPRGVFLGAIR